MNETNLISSPPLGKSSVCRVENCGRHVRAGALCVAHHKRLQKYGDVRAEVPIEGRRKSNAKNLCSVEGCERPYYALGMCATHRERMRRFGDPKKEVPVRNRKGGGHDRKGFSYTYWWGIRTQCANPKSKAYKNWGGKGLSVCEEWSTYARFVRDMGERPSRHHILVLNEGETVFALGTCTWQLKSEVNSIKCKISYEIAEKIRHLSVEGAEAKDLARDYGISVNNVYMILNRRTWK